MIDAILPKGVKFLYKWFETSVAERTKLEEEVQIQGRDQKNARKDMFHYFFQAKDPETGLPAYTPGELFMEAYLLIIAGSDTSTTTIAATIFYVTRNPRIYTRLAPRDSHHLPNGGRNPLGDQTLGVPLPSRMLGRGYAYEPSFLIR